MKEKILKVLQKYMHGELNDFDEITNDLIKVITMHDTLKYLGGLKNRNLDIDIILRTVMEYFEIKFFFVETRKREYVFARHVAMYLCRKYTNNSLAEIGFEFGQDHATVLHAIRKINNFLQIKDKKTVKVINDIDKLLINKI